MRTGGRWSADGLDERLAARRRSSSRHVAGRSERSRSGADAHAHQPPHRVADRLAHPPDLAVAALVDRDPQHARASAATTWAGAVDAVVELDALAQPAQLAPA